MSSVRKKDQSTNRFTTLDIILEMWLHTNNLLNNPKKFDRTYSKLIDTISYEARLIYHLCRVANEDLDNRIKDEAIERLRLQKQALQACKDLKTDIMLAKVQFHLRTKSVTYWTKLVNNAMKAIQNWHATERKLCRENHGV